jgi:hypothetical protein
MEPYTPLWQFDEIVKDDPARASALEAAPSSAALAEALTDTFSAALTSGHVRFGLEEARSNSNDVRAVLQFHVGARMFDWFFNARTGYRAQFCASWEAGLAYNFALIDALRKHVRALPYPTVTVRRLNESFEDCGAIEATVSQLVDSLEPHLSMVWVTSSLIQESGRVAGLPFGRAGPRILLEQGNTWAAIYQDDPEAWLEVKGAFLGIAGPYQSKDPIARAKNLQRTGEA